MRMRIYIFIAIPLYIAKKYSKNYNQIISRFAIAYANRRTDKGKNVPGIDTFHRKPEHATAICVTILDINPLPPLFI